MNELISIIVPVYNVEAYLRECLESIITQTYKNLEVILVDDGSTDHSGSICDEYTEEDKRVQVIHKENGGLSDARNAGIDIAKGQYIAFVDSDDFIHSRMVEILYARIKKEKADICICGFDIIDKNGNCIENESLKGLVEGIYTPKDIFEQSCKEDGWFHIVVWNKLYKAEIFKVLKFPKGKIHEDEYVFHNIIDKCSKCVVVNQSLYYYRRREGSITLKGYNIKEMDAVEALLYRCLYFKENKMKNCFVSTEKTFFYLFMIGLNNLKEEEIAIYIRKMKFLYKPLIFYVLINSKYSIRDKFKRIIFWAKPLKLKEIYER